jgi:hypothetical protein
MRMKRGKGYARGQFNCLDDVVVAIQIGEVEREDANNLRAVGEMREPEAGICVLRKPIKQDLHELKGIASAIDFGDIRAEAAAPGYVVCTAMLVFHTFQSPERVFEIRRLLLWELFSFVPPHGSIVS